MKRFAAACAALALAATLGACGTDDDPEATPTGAPTEQAPGDSPTAEPTPGPVDDFVAGEIRVLRDGYDLESTALALRSNFASWEPLTDQEVAQALNAGCDALAVEPDPFFGMAAIQNFGVTEIDAGFGLMSAISVYCPEHSDLLK